MLRFGDDGTFTVMQISDVQDIGALHPRASALIAAALDREKPGLVVLTGDQLKGYAPRLRFGGIEANRALVRRTLDSLLDLFEARGVPFTFTFGNHDHEAPLRPLEQLEHCQRRALCYAEHEPDAPGYGNHMLPIMNAQGKPALLLYCLDAHPSSNFSWDYTPLDPGQIAWYKQTRDAAAAQNGGQCVPSMLFAHVPVEELYALYREVPKGTPGALEGWGTRARKFYVLDTGKVEPHAFWGELPSCPSVNAGLFEAAREKSDMLGMFFGHDHSNAFCGDVQGVRLGSTPGAGYAAYGPGRRRGARVFRFHEDNLHAFETYVVTDEQLLGPGEPLGRDILLHDKAPTSPGQARLKLRDAAGKAAIVLGAAAGLALAAGTKKRRK